MKKLVVSLVLIATSSTLWAQQPQVQPAQPAAQQHRHTHNHRSDRDLLPTLILGMGVGMAIARPNQPVYQYPQPVYTPPQPIYIPHPRPSYGYPHHTPRIMSSHEPCQYIGQMVMTFDQWNQPMGFDACRP